MINFTEQRGGTDMLGDKIRKLRKARGMTQADLAEKLDVCRQTVMKWEKGVTEPDIDAIRAAAELFHISYAELLDPYTDDEGGIMELIHSYNPYIDDNAHRAVSGYVIDGVRRAGIPHAEVEVFAGSGRCVTKMTADERGFFIGSTGGEKQYRLRFTTPDMTYEIPKVRNSGGETYVGGVDLSIVDPEPVLPAEGVWGGNILWNIDENGAMTLSGKGDMEDRYSTLSGKKEISPYRLLVKKITIRNGITSVGAHAFDGFIHLEEVRIGRNVQRIRSGAFMGCKKLKNVTFAGNELTEVCWNAFRGCVSLTRVNLPESVKNVGSGAFADCVSLGTVTYASDAEIFAGAFSLCGNVKLPEKNENE